MQLDREAGHVRLLDQTLLPSQKVYLNIDSLEEACEAILNLRVRGAPAIGLFASFMIAVLMEKFLRRQLEVSTTSFLDALETMMQQLQITRPTAVNLNHCIKRLRFGIQQRLDVDVHGNKLDFLLDGLFADATLFYKEDRQLCEVMAAHAARLIPAGAVVLTHCNTGALATAGYGTAIGALYTAHAREIAAGREAQKVYAGETRPLLQGARLTAFELLEAGLNVKLIADSMAAQVMHKGLVDMVMVGADRITTNGDSANKIGTLGLAVLARHFGLPFYIVAPGTTIDPGLETGDQIEIEIRSSKELREFKGVPSAPVDVPVYNPAFDVTPGYLISGIITEAGVFRAPYDFSSH